jgi:phosphomannomutase
VSSPAIQFGPDGWRALIARDFTFDNVRLASQAAASCLRTELADPASSLRRRPPAVILAYDCRFLGRQFALAAAEVFAANGFKPILCDRDTPAPVFALALRRRNAIAGINITAGHSPPEYSGFQFSRHHIAGAPPEATPPIEAAIARLQRENWSFPAAVVGTFACQGLDPQPDYFRHIRNLVQFSTIKKARLKIGVDLMHGCGRGYLDAMLREAGARLTVLHGDPDPMFGGHPPEPAAGNLADLRHLARSGKVCLGLATDGDAGRFGVVDADGSWLTPNQVLVLTLYHLARNRGWKGAVVRTVVTSGQAAAVAAHFGIKTHETPAAFKHIGAILEWEPVIVGGGESGGLSMRGHMPENDGILGCLLMAELVAAEGKPLGAVLKDITKLTGAAHTRRILAPGTSGRKRSNSLEA